MAIFYKSESLLGTGVATILFVIEKSEETTFEFKQNAASCLILTMYKNGNTKNCEFFG